MFLVRSVEKLLGMVIFFGSALTPFWSKFVQILSFTIWYKGTRATGLNVCSGMVGCQHWLILVVARPWAETAEDIAMNRLERAYGAYSGRVRALDKAGNDFAHSAADLGWRRLLAGIICAGRLCTAACGEWYPFVFDLHRFFIAIARVVVNEDGHSDCTTSDC